jgi:hypothetical protein
VVSHASVPFAVRLIKLSDVKDHCQFSDVPDGHTRIHVQTTLIGLTVIEGRERSGISAFAMPSCSNDTKEERISH